jgi:hypothetical protein
MCFNIFKKKKRVIKGSCVQSAFNTYGSLIPCTVTRIYFRGVGSNKVKYCQLTFILDGLSKTVNVPFSSCKLHHSDDPSTFI